MIPTAEWDDSFILKGIFQARELTRIQIIPPAYGLGTSTSRQIFRAVNSLISRWRGKLVVFRLIGFHQIE